MIRLILIGLTLVAASAARAEDIPEYLVFKEQWLQDAGCAKSTLKTLPWRYDFSKRRLSYMDGSPLHLVMFTDGELSLHLNLEGGYPVRKCVEDGKPTSFLLFNIYSENEPLPVARVGLPIDDLSFLLNLDAIDISDEADVLSDKGEPQSQTQNLTSMKSGSSISPRQPPPQFKLVTRVRPKEWSWNPFEWGSNSRLGQEAEPSKRPSGAGKNASAPKSSFEKSPQPLTQTTDVSSLGFEYRICSDGPVKVREASLKKEKFQAQALEIVKPMQSWSGSTRSYKVNGQAFNFVEVQFPNRGQASGWIAETFVKLASDCEHMKPSQAKPAPSIDSSVSSVFNFPTVQRPTHSYRDGMRAFGARRSKGRRLHAACDLYRVHGEAAEAITDGQVLRGPYYFYEGTYALEVRHTGGLIARYGEILGRKPAGVSVGSKVRRGQTLGYIGTVNSGCCRPMLHFELYSGKAKGSLSGGGRFQRRSDLIDPTSKLQAWEVSKFGVSY